MAQGRRGAVAAGAGGVAVGDVEARGFRDSGGRGEGGAGGGGWLALFWLWSWRNSASRQLPGDREVAIRYLDAWKSIE